MKSKLISHLLVVTGFIGFLFLCSDNEQMDDFLFNKYVGITLILTAYSLSMLLKSRKQLNHHK